jgi:hypothetical protein
LLAAMTSLAAEAGVTACGDLVTYLGYLDQKQHQLVARLTG